jgi:Na+/proline symporter/signal transduction histidine kinase/ActR/RegA family two-component response regulator
MLSTWGVILIALGYVGVLFAIAAYGDRVSGFRRGFSRPYVYALSIAVYCTSWTFYGSVGLASTTGYDFLAIYLGPILLIGLGWPLIRHIVNLSKSQNITSIADFLAARYGKNQLLGGLAAAIAVIGIIPYISLQLKAVALSLSVLGPLGVETSRLETPFGDMPMFIAIAMAIFAMLFGTRHADATEHQNGLILSVAAESVVKLVAFMVVGMAITFWLMGGPASLYGQAANDQTISTLFTSPPDPSRFITMTLLSLFAIILLPRQFHVTVVENTSIDDVRKAAWMFPLYLVAINIFVVPIAIAGMIAFKGQPIDGDMFVLALPVAQGESLLAMLAFIGGLSAATAMVIVETVALSIMVCNSIVVPLMLRSSNRSMWQDDVTGSILQIRRVAIGVIIVLAYSYYLMIGNNAALAQTGLVSFAAIAQFAPAFFIGLVWSRGNARGAMAGLMAGFALWAYTLLLPLFADAGWLGYSFIANGPWGIEWLRPRQLFSSDFDALTHGIFWSLFVNTAVYLLVSLMTSSDPIERMQAQAFVPSGQTAATASIKPRNINVSMGQVQATVERYLGKERSKRSFDEFHLQNGGHPGAGAIADPEALKFAERLLASAIGIASARVVMALLLQRGTENTRGAMRLLDDASDAIVYNRDLLQSAIDHVQQGIAVFDHDLSLVCWNNQFRNLLSLPPEMGRVGVPLGEVLSRLDREFEYEGRALSDAHTQVLRLMVMQSEPFQINRKNGGEVLEVRSNAMPDNGRVLTFTDITERVQVAQALEQRVRERTQELTALNAQLEKARAQAGEANAGKTRFIAAASHDILQPLNAARLFTASLLDRTARISEGELVRNVDQSLEAVEEIFSALLDISRLDAGAINPDVTRFAVGDLLNQLKTEFSLAAAEKGLKLTIVPSSQVVLSDRRLLRRILQNLLSNAIKYTSSGKVLMGCRRRGDTLLVEVHDTGPGIPADKQELVYREFERLDHKGSDVSGLGLGLSIVQRMARVLDHPLKLRSEAGQGCVFQLQLPAASSQNLPIAQVRPQAMSVTARLAGLSVLVVDNEKSIIDGMTSLLEGWGCKVTSARTASAARKLVDAATAEGQLFDAVLMDYHLNRENGLDLIAELRSRTGQRFGAVLITAERSAQVQARAESEDIAYLRKPVRPAILRNVLSMTRLRQEAAE